MGQKKFAVKRAGHINKGFFYKKIYGGFFHVNEGFFTRKFYNNNNNNGIYIALIHRCSKRFTM